MGFCLRRRDEDAYVDYQEIFGYEKSMALGKMQYISNKEKILLLQWLGIFLILGAIVMSEYETLKRSTTQLSD